MQKEKKSLRQKFITDSFWSVSNSIVGRVGGLIFTIILARLLLPEKFGIYSLAMSIALIFLTFADLGINQTNTVFVSSLLKKRNKSASYFRYILNLKIILSLIVFFSLAILAYPLSFFVFKNSELFFPLLFLSFYILIFAIEGFFESLYFVFNKVKFLVIREFLFQVIRIILLLLIFYFVDEEFYILSTIIILIISHLVISIFIYLKAKRFSASLFGVVDKKMVNRVEVKKFLFFTSIGTLSVAFLSYIDVIMLGIFVSPINIGLYKASAALIFGILSVINFYNIILPAFSQIKKKNTDEAFNKLLKHISSFSIPAVIGIIILGRYLIKAVYGESYLSATIFLYVLAPLLFIESVAALFGAVLTSNKRPDILFKPILFSSVLDIILNFVLIMTLLKYSELHATIGAAVATVVSRIVYFLLIVYLTKKTLKFTPRFGVLWKPVFSSFVMFFVISLLMESVFQDINIISGVLIVLLSIFIHFFVLYLIKGFSFSEIFPNHKKL